ncbi:low affinity immunoglobulin epsilon Fc receptor-like [Asterias amurensis]|uniref:low affinity immunoglobulin epsilon Fc receptor-like n=1 Tax=Asterias amurensis TaxID=7602 RepID=UPI003AB63972
MAWKNPSLSKILFVLIVSTSNKVNGRCQKEGACPADWSKWGNNCYHFVENGLYWAQAQQHCVDIGGVLTAPHSREEEDYLLAWTNAGQLWINCNDISSEGTWECKEGTTTVDYRRWSSPPDNNGGGDGEDCAGMLSQGWNDISCTRWQEKFVCKQPIPIVWV